MGVKGKWRVTSNPMGDGVFLYGVYRIIDTNEVDHSGNREQYGDFMKSKDEADAIADRLNAKEGGAT